MIFMQVDLPEPEEPTMAVNSPSMISKEMRSAAVTVLSPMR